MERFDQLRLDYEQVQRFLACPLSLEDFDQLKERSEKIREEAKALSQKPNIKSAPWFACP